MHLLRTAFIFQNELSECWALLAFIVMPLHIVTVNDSSPLEEHMGVYDC